MQPYIVEQGPDYGLDLFQSMKVDSHGMLQGGFSTTFAELPSKQPLEGAKNVNCKGGNCGNCTICPPKPK
jgi:hypothetical protein